MDIPEIRYARSGEVHIAYQTWGEGPPLVGVPPFAQNIEALWGDPTGLYPRFLRSVGSFATVTHFDKRGTGLSDRPGGSFSIEARMDDLRAVMDALGIEKAFLGGISEGGPMAMLFAATFPERVNGLLLAGTTARFTSAADYPIGIPAELLSALGEQVAELWSTPESLVAPLWMPSLADNTEFRRWGSTYERACASPGAVRDIFQFLGTIDVRDVLSHIQCPTVIAHRTGDGIVPVEQGRYLAEHIAGATYHEYEGVDHVPWVGPNAERILDFMEELVTGSHTEDRKIDRYLATVLYTDIVNSTAQLAELGDSRWFDILNRHDAISRDQIAALGGREINMTGDGFVAEFDNPARAIRAASAIQSAVRKLGIEVRAGVHTGELEYRGSGVGGLTLHIGARVAALAGASEIVASPIVRELTLGAGFEFVDAGIHHLKGVDGEWPLLKVAVPTA